VIREKALEPYDFMVKSGFCIQNPYPPETEQQKLCKPGITLTLCTNKAISQSPAGRTAMPTLWPFFVQPS